MPMTWTRTTTLAIAATIAAACGGSDWTQAERNQVRDTCTQAGGPAGYCSCVARELSSRLTANEAKRAVTAMQLGQPAPDKVVDAIAACLP